MRRESIGYVFQSFHLLPTLTAFENIELPLQLIDMPTGERWIKLKISFDLWDFLLVQIINQMH